MFLGVVADVEKPTPDFEDLPVVDLANCLVFEYRFPRAVLLNEVKVLSQVNGFLESPTS